MASSPLALDVRFRWGDQQLAAGLFDEPRTITVGPGKGATFQLGAAFIPGEHFPLLRQQDGAWFLTLTDRMSGELIRGDQRRPLRDAPGQTGDHDTGLELSPDCAAWVDLGQIRADLRFRPRPRAALSPLTDRLDYPFLNLFFLALFCAAAGVVAFENHATDTDLRADDVFANRPNFVKMIIRPPEKKPNRLLEKLKALDVSNTPAASAARASKPEGQAGKKTAQARNSRSAPRAIDPNDKEQVKQQGLLAMLGKAGHSGLSTVLGPNGLGGELQGAIGQISGPQVGDAHGFGALGLKGTGPGGPGHTLGAGDLDTNGRGGGKPGYGSNARGLGPKGSTDPVIDPTREIVIGSLDRELIRKVIHAHRAQIRYCYESELARNPDLGGRIAIRFVITATGSVSSAASARTTMNNPTVESCIAARVKSWEFPRPLGGGVVVVTYPFLFKQSGE